METKTFNKKLCGWEIFMRTAKSFGVDYESKDWPKFGDDGLRSTLQQCICLNNILTKELKDYKNESYKKHYRPKKRAVFNADRRAKGELRPDCSDGGKQVSRSSDPDGTMRNGLRENEERRAPNSFHGLIMKYYDIKEASEFMRVSERTLRQIVSDGKIRFARVGSRIIIPEHCIHEFFDLKLTSIAE